MLTYIERIELRDKLLNGENDIEFALEHYWNGFKRRTIILAYKGLERKTV